MRGFSTIGPLIPNWFYGFRRLRASWVVRVIRLPTSIALGARMFEQIMREQLDVDAVRTPRTEMGPAAARMLLALMSGEAVASPCVDLGYELAVRAST